MFSGCTGLTSIPANLLPATTLAEYCYNSMFSGCTGLTSIPANLLPATTLANYCYYYMFSGCTGLTSLPANLLPATTLTVNCYYYMFYNNTALTNIGNINANWFTARSSTEQSNMFYNCTNITTPITYANIPVGWK
jgi:dihydrodipicolinate synthase/N-acetylneuraminate lyase